jgi:membrane-bound metal-dependent hydrolase YbcI (DUF457 family)
MAQFAVHLGTGILWKNAPKVAPQFLFGVMAGSVLPDFDFIPLALVFFFDSTLARTLHRSFSHSLLIPLVLLLVAAAFYILRRPAPVRSPVPVLLGIALGMVSHVLLDILFWFGSVNVLWPLNLFGYPTIVSIWNQVTLPSVWLLWISADGELLAYAVLYSYYRHLLKRNPSAAQKVNLTPWIGITLALFLVFIPLAWVLSVDTYQTIVYGANAAFFAPLCMGITWKLRGELISA